MPIPSELVKVIELYSCCEAYSDNGVISVSSKAFTDVNAEISFSTKFERNGSFSFSGISGLQTTALVFPDFEFIPMFARNFQMHFDGNTAIFKALLEDLTEFERSSSLKNEFFSLANSASFGCASIALATILGLSSHNFLKLFSSFSHLEQHTTERNNSTILTLATLNKSSDVNFEVSIELETSTIIAAKRTQRRSTDEDLKLLEKVQKVFEDTGNEKAIALNKAAMANLQKTCEEVSSVITYCFNEVRRR